MVRGDMGSAFEPGRLGGLEIPNRVLKAATFEGMTPDARPSETLKNFHVRLAEGEIGMTTIAYCTTEPDGRINPNMMYLRPEIEPELKDMIAEIKKHGTRVSGQMTHCGNFSSNPDLVRLKKPLGPTKQFSFLGASVGHFITGEMTHDDIDYLVETYRDAAALMKRVGFDATEIHFGHGYGLSQFISPKTNKRSDDYGGPLENRMRVPLRVLAAVREAVGPDFPIIGKISMTDGVKGGVTWDEGIEVAKHLDAAGIDAIVPSAGTSSFNVMLMFRGDPIIKGMIERETNPFRKMALRVLAPVMFKTYEYQENFLMDRAKAVKDAVKCPVIYIGGCSNRESLDRIFDAGFEFVQLGRALSKDPDFVKNAKASKDYKSGCIHCNRCVALIDDPGGIRCVLNDKREEKHAA